MEAVTAKSTKSTGSNTPPIRTSDGKAVPNYLRPSADSCHHVCKYGGKHTFEDREAHKAQPKPRKQPQPAVSDNQERTLIKARVVSRRRVGDFSKPEKVNKAVVDKEKEVETVEWKDIVAYDTNQAYGSSPQPEKFFAEVANSGDDKKKDVMKGKRSHDKGKTTEQEIGVKKQNESLNKKLVKSVRSKLTRKASTEPQAANKAASPSPKNTNMITGRKSVKPPKGKKAATLSVEKKAADQDMVQEGAGSDEKEGKTLYPLDQEEYAAAQSSRPIPVHRRVKSMSISSRSVRFPFVRQASNNSATFKLRSKGSKAPILPVEEKPTRFRFRKGRVAGEESSSGIQLRIRSLRRRGVGVSGGSNTGFVVPAVTLKHQKTLEKKRSQRLYNNLIEETASKLAKTRKSRVKALVGAFETLISKIGK